MTVAYDAIHDLLDARTLDILARREGSRIKRRGWLMRRMLVAADLAGLTLAFGTAEVIFVGRALGQGFDPSAETVLFFLSLPVWVVVAKLYGLYDRDEERADHSTADEVMGVFHLATVGTWLLFVTAWLTGIAHPQLPKLITFWAFVIVAIPIARGAARAYCRRSVFYLQNALILGAGEVGQQIARKLLKHPEYGINVVGFVDANPRERGDDLEHLTVLGGVEDVRPLVRLLDVERVIVAFSNDDREDVVDLMRDLNQLDIQVDLVPRFFDILNSAVDIHAVEGLPLIGLRPPRLSRSSAYVKRVVDVLGSAVGLVVLAPLLAAIAVAIKLDSRGPVFFRQTRMGIGDCAFRIVKLRTMVADADAHKAELAHLNKHAREDCDSRMFKIDQDPRVTRVGAFLRRFSLDELPQLWNVLVGEMSLVGPRPLVLDEHAYVVDWARRRLDLRPGITGLWQVLGRDEIPFDEMVRLDYRYVTSWSLGGDIRLLLRTVPALFKGA